MIYLFTLTYLYAGFLISNLFVKLLESKEPNFFLNLHKKVNAPWEFLWTKIILRVIYILVWPCVSFIR